MQHDVEEDCGVSGGRATAQFFLFARLSDPIWGTGLASLRPCNHFP